MESIPTAIDTTDNGGRRRIRDRRFLVSAPVDRERRTYWERRSGYDRRMRRVPAASSDRRLSANPPAEKPR